MWFKDKEFQYGICINSIECSEKKNARKKYKIYKGCLVEISERNNKILLSLVKVKLECYAQSLTTFRCLDTRLFRYLNAINNIEERLKFYEDATRREFVLQLNKTSCVNVAFPNGQYTKAIFQKEHVYENNEILITVELLEEIPEFLKTNKDRYFGTENKNKKANIFSFSADMIRKCDFHNVDKKVAEYLQIPKTNWRCIVCLEETLAGNNRCQHCRTAYLSPNANPNVCGNNLNTKQSEVQRNSQVNKRSHPNVQNSTSRISTKTSDYVVSNDESNTDFDRSNHEHKFLHTAETKTSYLQSDGPYQKIGATVHGDEEAYKQNSISQNQTRYVLLQNELCRQKPDILNNEDKTYVGSMAVEHNAKSENYNFKTYEVSNVHSVERRRQTVETTWKCFGCQSSNECFNNICRCCGEKNAEIPYYYNSQTSIVANCCTKTSDSNPYEIESTVLLGDDVGTKKYDVSNDEKITASYGQSDVRTRPTEVTSWTCIWCLYPNECISNICQKCGDTNEELSRQ